MKKSLVLHPFLFAAYPVLALFSHNRFEVCLEAILVPLTVSVCLALLSWLLLWRILRCKQRAGLLVSLAIVLFFSYGHLFFLVQGWSLGSFHVGRNRYLLALWFVVLLAGVIPILRPRRNLAALTPILNLASAVLVAMALGNIVWFEMLGRVSVAELAVDDDAEWTSRTGPPPGAHKPDIYYIILDRYASSRTLQSAYNFDNADFISQLQARGFFVASESRCNYPATFLSMASSLNLTYLDKVNALAASSQDRTIVYRLLDDYKVQRYLRSEGYRYIHLGSWWQPTRSNQHADWNIEYGPRVSEFAMQFVHTTMLGPIFPDLFSRVRVQRERVLFKFDVMADVIDEPNPKFVFIHMLVPHDPYLFNPDGTAVTTEQLNQRSERDNYVNQLVFTNERISQLLDQILTRSKQPPVILLSADEGLKPSHTDGPNVLGPEETRRRTDILNAYYLPGVDRRELYTSITPVNTFRLVLNLYFGTDYELLEDRVYWFEDESRPYRFVDVTERSR